ncbi:hypothetical protein LMG23992_00335 [Cupriavidus laharis]|uniref:Transposase n=1 Tax=Cupriavidus laharis TaxID=151654 RepID=A0ABN7XYF2_9BURK|nr:hypothetical protein LMG23992_00335 [Cupriavidus laharis]
MPHIQLPGRNPVQAKRRGKYKTDLPQADRIIVIKMALGHS